MARRENAPRNPQTMENIGAIKAQQSTAHDRHADMPGPDVVRFSQ
jgi:hypothetical protein